MFVTKRGLKKANLIKKWEGMDKIVAYNHSFLTLEKI